MKELLITTDLKLNYGPIAALKGVDICVPEGQIVAILGANGAGKTSLLKTVSGLLKPAAGEIIYDGVLCKSRCQATVFAQIFFLEFFPRFIS